jgi:nicotinate-nucleotide adenylyltransferase
MNIGLYGGSFDPIHNGHLAVARAAAERFALKQIHFVVTALSPHKLDRALTPFEHRYAMVCIATADEKNFIPSLLEAPQQGPNYAIDTVRAFKRTAKKADRIFYIIGMDAFGGLDSWREPEALLREVEFIVASRPGHSMSEIARALPESLRPSDSVIRASAKQKAQGSIVLPGVAIHLLDGVEEPAASRDVRSGISSGKGMKRFLPDAVASYIKKTGLYRRATGEIARQEKIERKPAKASGAGRAKRATTKPAKVLEFNASRKQAKH